LIIFFFSFFCSLSLSFSLNACHRFWWKLALPERSIRSCFD